MKKIVSLCVMLLCIAFNFNLYAADSEPARTSNLNGNFYEPGDTLTLTIDQVIGSPSEMVEVNVLADGFFELAVFEGTIEWDDTVLDFVEVTNFGVDNLRPENFGEPSGVDSLLTFSWTEASVAGKSVPDSTVIFTLVFQVIGDAGTSSTVAFADSPLDVSAADNNLEPIVVLENDGQVTIIAPINIDATVQDVSCNGGNDGFIALDVSGGSEEFTYLWSNGATTDSIGGLEAGTYTFTITDVSSGAEITNSVPVVSPEAMVLSILNESMESDTLGSISSSVSGGVPPYLYSWSNGETEADLVGIENGTYTLTVTDFNGCEVIDSIELDHMMTSSLTQLLPSQWEVSPNPTRDVVNVTLSEDAVDMGVGQWTVFNVLGERVANGTVVKGQDSFQVNLTGASPGLYYLNVGREMIPVVLAR